MNVSLHKKTNHSTMLLLLVVLTCVHADLWIPTIRETVVGNYTIRQHNLIISPPRPPDHDNSLIDEGYTGEISQVEIINAQGRCLGGRHEEKLVIKETLLTVKTGECRISVDAYVIESLSAPGTYHICKRNWSNVDLLILERCYSDGVRVSQIIIGRKNHSCSRVKFTVDLNQVSSDSLVRALCRNFGIRFRYHDGKSVSVEDTDSPEGIKRIRSVINGQGVEIRHEINNCKTPRCLVLPRRRSRREVHASGVGCWSFLFGGMCPYAVHRDDLRRYDTELRHMVRTSMTNLEDKIYQRFDTINDAINASLELLIRDDKMIASQIQTLKDLHDSMAASTEGLSLKLHVVSHQEATLRGISDTIIKRRIFALEVARSVVWINNIGVAGIECQRGDCKYLLSLLGEKDTEVTLVTQAGFNVHPIATFYHDKLEITYFKPHNYSIKRHIVQYLPGIKIEDECDAHICKFCLHQEPHDPILPSGIVDVTDMPSEIIFNPFDIRQCRKSGAPNKLIIRAGSKCLSLSVRGMDDSQCLIAGTTMEEEAPHYTLDVPLAVSWTVIEEYKPVIEVKLQAEKEVKRIMMRTKTALKQMHQDALVGIDKNLGVVDNRMVVINQDARNALIVASVALGGVILMSFYLIYMAFHEGRKLTAVKGTRYNTTNRPNTVTGPGFLHTKTMYMCSGNIPVTIEEHAYDTTLRQRDSGIKVGNIVLPLFSLTEVSSDVCRCREVGIIIIKPDPTKQSLYPLTAVNRQRVTIEESSRIHEIPEVNIIP